MTGVMTTVILVCALAAAQVLLKYAELWAAPRTGTEGRRAEGSP